MNDSRMDENMAINRHDDCVQVEEQTEPGVYSNVAVIPDQHDQIPADSGVGRGSELIPKYQHLELGGNVTRPRPLSQVPPIGDHISVKQFMNLGSSSGVADLRSVTVSPRRIRNLSIGLVPEERDDGDISDELSNAVAADDDIPAGHIRVRVTVHNTCPIAGCKTKNYVKFMTIVSPEDVATRLSETTTAYFYCYRCGCDYIFGVEDDPTDRWDDSSRCPCPQCNSPLKTSFLFRSRFWKRFTRQPCGAKHGNRDKNPESETLDLNRMNIEGSID